MSGKKVRDNKHPGVILITGTRKGIGRYLAHYYSKAGFMVFGCSRKPIDFHIKNYHHFCLDVSDEKKVKEVLIFIKKRHGRLDVLINNAGCALMNHLLLTPIKSLEKTFKTNYYGTFIFSREASKVMKINNSGRIINFTSIAVPLKIEGEAIYASSKAAITSLTQIMAKELAPYNITVNAIGPSPISTDLIKSVPVDKIRNVLEQQSIKRLGKYRDISNVCDFFMKYQSDFITGQIIYLGGI